MIWSRTRREEAERWSDPGKESLSVQGDLQINVVDVTRVFIHLFPNSPKMHYRNLKGKTHKAKHVCTCIPTHPQTRMAKEKQ